ncbi:MAG: DNA double-strand break repair nuclease NurA [Promethearchaeota archaeon]
MVIKAKSQEGMSFLSRHEQELSIKKRIDIISKAIVEVESQKRKFLEGWLKIKEKFAFPEDFKKHYNIIDAGLFKKSNPAKLSGKRIAAVDGSVLRETMLGVDLIASKATGVSFDFHESKPPLVKYFPDATDDNFNLFGVFRTVLSQEIDYYVNVERLLSELELVFQIVSSDPYIDLMIIDGPLYIPEIINTNELFFMKKYNKQITNTLIKILETCQKNRILLVGVIKDSIKNEHVSILGKILPFMLKEYPEISEMFELDFRKLINMFRDYDFFFRFLKEGERSFIKKIYPISMEKQGNSMSLFRKFLEENEMGIYAHHLKAVPMDVPLKLEFIAKNKSEIIREQAKKITSLIYPVSKIMVDYSEPSPQMEAHKRVKIPEQDFKTIINVIRQKTGYCSTLMPKRRERRPF